MLPYIKLTLKKNLATVNRKIFYMQVGLLRMFKVVVSGGGRSAFLPEFGHVFEGLAFGFGHELVDEQGGNDTHDAVEGVDEAVAEFVAHVADADVVHRDEGRRDDEIEYPLEGYGDCHGGRSDRVGEDLGDQNPADGSPGEHERS